MHNIKSPTAKQKVNRVKYIELVEKLRDKFPLLVFSMDDFDYSMAPSKHATLNKHTVTCTIHGDFQIHLYTMGNRGYGCTACGRASRVRKITGVPKPSGKKVLTKLSKENLKQVADKQVLGWSAPKRKESKS